MNYETNSGDDLRTIMEVLDRAMMSDDSRIQDALKRLMVTSALIDINQDSAKRLGPLRRISQDNENLQHRLGQLEMEMRELKNHLRSVSLVPHDQLSISGLDTITLSNIQNLDLSAITGSSLGVQAQGPTTGYHRP